MESAKKKPSVVIVTPGTREANNGNWRTAQRWAGFLAPECDVIVQSAWQAERADLLLALHARRSHASIAAFRAAHPRAPVIVALTGTDLYKDLPEDRDARDSLAIANRLVVLQDDAPRQVPLRWRRKCRVVYQSARVLEPAAKLPDRLDCIVVGHLRPEKDPLAAARALALIPRDVPVYVRHVGEPLDATLAAEAREAARRDPRYRWIGGLPHGLTRAAIKEAHLLVHTSLMEGGANVIAEAVTAGTPVVASRIPGNLGMLGVNYPGYFEVGNASALAALLVSLLEHPERFRDLTLACASRLPLFSPERERESLLALVLAAARKARR
jgi:putative glycosyltransferase (TIGR04348 family)